MLKNLLYQHLCMSKNVGEKVAVGYCMCLGSPLKMQISGSSIKCLFD